MKTSEPGTVAGRIVFVSTFDALAVTENGEARVYYPRGMEAPGREGGVCVGDWVHLTRRADRLYVERILPRKSRFVRRASGAKPREQLVAVNMDLTLIVTSANAEWNLSRLERYLASLRGCGATPLVVLNKCDLCAEPDAFVRELHAIAPDVECLRVSAATGEGVEALAERMSGRTSALVGSSGVGKSTLLNRVAGNALQYTQAIREDDAHGRHTTTSRHLFLLSDSICVIDTPGMRTLGLWNAPGMSDTFPELEALAAKCRFRDCRHDGEPGCAIEAAARAGQIDRRRLKNYLQLTRQG